MNIESCINCKKDISPNSKFCGNCGTQLKCTGCGESLSPENRFCENCGKQINNSESRSEAPNKIKFKENHDGRLFEAEFSDEVGKDITSSLGNILKQRNIELQSGSEGNGFHDKNANLGSQIEDIQYEEASQAEAKKVDANYPSMQRVKLKNLPASEAEWLVVYGFYSSNYGEKEFSRNDLIELYSQTGRRTDSRIANLSNNIKKTVKENYFNPLNENEFSLLDDGLKKAKEIISRTSGSPAKIVSKKQSQKETDDNESKAKTEQGNDNNEKPKRRTKKGYEVIDLGLDENKRQKLREFHLEKKPKSQEDLVLVLGYWLQKEGGIDGFNVNEIYTAIQIVSEKTPTTLDQVLRNAKNNGKISKSSDTSLYKLNHVGQDHVKFTLPIDG